MRRLRFLQTTLCLGGYAGLRKPWPELSPPAYIVHMYLIPPMPSIVTATG